MAHRNKVVRSLESPCGTRCVDIYRAPEGPYGFAEYRRDPEDPLGWRPTGLASRSTFATAEATADAARTQVGWLAELNSDAD